jgi:PAS domain S-box-containing protein
LVRNPRFLPLGLLLLGFGLAGWIAVTQSHNNDQIRQAHFTTLSERTVGQLRVLFRTYEYGLRSARGTILSMGPTLSRERFRLYVASGDIAREFPGSVGFGFAQRVSKHQEDAFLREAGADGYPDFKVHAFRPNEDERLIVRYFEPLSANRRAIGLDLASEEVRRDTALHAFETGDVTLTPPIQLMQAKGPPRLGLLLLLAVYPEGAQSAHRASDAVGLVYSPLRLADVFAEFDLRSNDYALRLTDVTDPSHPVPIFASRNARRPRDGELFGVVPVHVGGRIWSAELSARDSFLANLPLHNPRANAALTALFTLLLSGLLFTHLAATERDLSISVERERLAAIVESSADAIVSKTLSGIITSWNSGASRMFGYTKEEMLGQSIQRLFAGHGEDEERRLLAVSRGESNQAMETVRVAKNGQPIDVALTVSPIRDRTGKIIGASSVARDISERKHAEDIRRESERRLGAVLESTPHLVWSSDPDGFAEYFSPQWSLYTGVSESELLGLEWRSFIHPDDFNPLRRQWKTANLAREVFDAQVRIRRHDGVYRWFKVRAAHVLNERGEIIKWFGSNTDVQELRDAQESLSRLNHDLEARVLARTNELSTANQNLATIAERLQLATSVAAMGVWDWNVQEGRFVADETMRDVYHLAPGENAEASEYWWAFVYPPDRSLVDKAFSDALTGERELEVGYRILRKDGVVRHIRTTAATHRDGAGRPLRMVGLNWDITEQRSAELQLQSSEALQRVILDAAGSAIVATDRDGLITRFNPAAEALTGYSADEVVGRENVAMLHDAAEVAARRKQLQPELGNAAHDMSVFVMKPRDGWADASEWTFVRKDGTRVPILLTMTTMRDSDGQVFGYLGVAVDLTDRKHHETELLKLNRMLEERSVQAESASRAKSMFLANMSHEIRTPMNAITGVTYLLGRTNLSPEQRDLLRTVQGASKVLLSMINDVLDLSKIEAQQFALEVAPFSVLRVLDDVAAFMAGHATHKQLELVIDAPVELPEWFCGDAVRLTQILTNLTNNAIKFTSQGSVTLQVRLDEAEGDCVRLCFEVSDTGVGMSPELVEKLFTPFTQADESSTRRVGGTGLGLSIVKEFVRLMGGNVFVHSSLGVGSQLGCVIPFRLSAAPEEQRVPPLSLLVADDHPGQLSAIVHCAERLHWQVTRAHSWSEAFQLLGTQPNGGFDLAILDWHMNGMDGWAQVPALRNAMQHHREILVVATSYDASARRADGEVVVHAVLAKPVTSSTLLAAVSAAHARRPQRHGFFRPLAHQESAERLVGARVLVVDDSDVNLDIARRILEIQGASVKTAAGGAEAVDLIKDDPHAFDVVLMDIQMPDVDGLEATRRIRELGGLEELPIIALSAGTLVSEQARALEIGMNDFISKPFEPASLIARVREHAERARKSPLPAPKPSTSHKALARIVMNEVEWPAVAGIDADDARTRLAGDVALFDSLLARLLAELSEVRSGDPLPSEMPARAALASRLHRLRGSAGNLGALSLHRIATQLEEILRGSSDDAEEAELWVDFQAALQQLSDSGEEHLRTRKAREDAPSSDADGTVLDADTLNMFVRLLGEQNLDALSVFESVGAALQERLGPAEGPLLREAVENLDFPKALALVTKLRVA